MQFLVKKLPNSSKLINQKSVQLQSLSTPPGGFPRMEERKEKTNKRDYALWWPKCPHATGLSILLFLQIKKPRHSWMFLNHQNFPHIFLCIMGSYTYQWINQRVGSLGPSPGRSSSFPAPPFSLWFLDVVGWTPFTLPCLQLSCFCLGAR